MFGFSNKFSKKRKIDNRVIVLMKNYSNETEKSFRNLIKYSKEDFPDKEIKVVPYGLYKARLGTNLCIAAGANSSKIGIGYGDSEDFYDDVKIAYAIAHKPFSEEDSIEYLDRSKISESSDKIMRYLLENLKKDPIKIYSMNINENDEVFKKLMIYFHNCIAESCSDKITIGKIIKLNETLFKHLTIQNLKIMSEFMHL